MTSPDGTLPWYAGSDTGVWFVGAGLAGRKPADPAPGRDCVVARLGFSNPDVPVPVVGAGDDILRDFGHAEYERMRQDPAVGSFFDLFRMLVLGADFQWTPAIHGKPVTAEMMEADDPKIKRAVEFSAFCERSSARLANVPGQSIESVGWELLDGMATCHALAEMVTAEGTGEDAGREVMDRIKVKPKWSYDFVVDGWMNITGYWVLTGENSVTREYVNSDKFMLFAWDTGPARPFGRSVFRRAWNAFRLKIRSWPNFDTNMAQFGSPSLVAELALDAQQVLMPDGSVMPAAQFLGNQLANYKSGTALVVPAGTKVTVLDVKDGGQAFERAIDLLNREIALAILYTTRAVTEAQHGSKADSEGSADLLGAAVRKTRRRLAGVIGSGFRALLRRNFPADEVEAFMPAGSFGGVEHQDFPAMLTAAANAMRSRFFSPSQLPGMDARLGLPIRTPEEADEAIPDPTLAADMQAQEQGAGEGGPNAKQPAKGGKKAA